MGSLILFSGRMAGGVDDARYLTTLLKAIANAKAAGKDTSAAETWLAGLKSSI